MIYDPEYSVIDGHAILRESHTFCVEGRTIVVQAGYVWNGSNIPWLIQWLFGTPLDKVHDIPSLDHDRTYEVGHKIGIKRSVADRKYRIDILARGQHPILAWLEWFNVRLFGWRYWETK